MDLELKFMIGSAISALSNSIVLFIYSVLYFGIQEVPDYFVPPFPMDDEFLLWFIQQYVILLQQGAIGSLIVGVSLLVISGLIYKYGIPREFRFITSLSLIISSGLGILSMGVQTINILTFTYSLTLNPVSYLIGITQPLIPIFLLLAGLVIIKDILAERFSRKNDD